MNLAYCCRACKITELKEQKSRTTNSLVLQGFDVQIELAEKALLLCPNCANPDCPRVENHQNHCARPI